MPEGLGEASGRVGLVGPGSAAPHGRTPYPIQQIDERLITQASRCFRKLAYDEVRLLLAGAWLAEGYAPDLYHRRASTGKIRPAAHLTRSQFRRCFDQKNLLLSGGSTPPLIRYKAFVYRYALSDPGLLPGVGEVEETNDPREAAKIQKKFLALRV